MQASAALPGEFNERGEQSAAVNDAV